MGNVILITSGKGGAGKTTFTVNLGCTLAAAGAKVLLLDFNMGLRNIDIYLGMENESLFDLGDVFSGVCRLDKAIVQNENCSNLSLLCCPQYKSFEGLTEDHVKILFDTLRKDYDFILVDTRTGLWDELSLAASCADEALVIMDPDYVSVRNADSVDRMLEDSGILKRFYAVNRVKPNILSEDLLPGPDYIAKVFKTPLAGIVLEDENINYANNAGVPICIDQDSYIARNFAEIAAKLIR